MLIKKERLTELGPIEVGAMTYGDPDTVKSFTSLPKLTSHRFEPGSKAMLEVIALGATLDLFQSVGIQQIFEEACRMTERLRTGLQALGYQVLGGRGAILNVVVNDMAKRGLLGEKLFAAKIGFAKRGPGIRLSPHAYNTEEEIDFVLKVLGS